MPGRRVTTREAIALLDREPALARINGHLRHKAANLRSVALDAGIVNHVVLVYADAPLRQDVTAAAA